MSDNFVKQESWSPWFFVQLFYKEFRGVRIVEAEDSYGVKGKCVLVPMDINGIVDMGHGPIQTLAAFKTPPHKWMKTLGALVPFISTDNAKIITERGILSPSDAKKGKMAEKVGVIKKDFYGRTHFGKKWKGEE